MTTAIDSKTFTPSWEPIRPRDLNWIGRMVYWVRSAEDHSPIYRATIAALAIFSSIVMLASIIGIPLFLACFKEHIRQQQRSVYDAQFQKLTEQAKDNNRHQFSLGIHRSIPENISLPVRVRDRIIQELKIPEEQAIEMKDLELAKSAAHLHPDWITHYGMKVDSPRRFL